MEVEMKIKDKQRSSSREPVRRRLLIWNEIQDIHLCTCLYIIYAQRQEMQIPDAILMLSPDPMLGRSTKIWRPATTSNSNLDSIAVSQYTNSRSLLWYWIESDSKQLQLCQHVTCLCHFLISQGLETQNVTVVSPNIILWHHKHQPPSHMSSFK